MVSGATVPESDAPGSLEASREGELDERLDLIDAVIYADLFDCAVTTEEAWRFSRRPISRAEFRGRLKDDPVLAGHLSGRYGLHCLAGREELLESRSEKSRRALRLRGRARRVAGVLQHLPFVRGLLLTGSAAAHNADTDADVDMLVLVSPGRLSTVFFLLGGLSRMLSRSVFCPNHYLSQAHLALRRRDVYVAHELLQAYPLAGEAELLRAANGWAAGLLPNAAARTAHVRPLPGGTTLQRLLEWPLRGRLGDALDQALLPLALARLENHHRAWGSSSPADADQDLRTGVQLRFHASPENQSVMLRYERRRDEVAASLRHR